MVLRLQQPIPVAVVVALAATQKTLMGRPGERDAGDPRLLALWRTAGPAERRHLRGPGPAPALAGPLLDQVLVSASQAAQLSHGLRLGVVLIALSLCCAKCEPGDLGQQVRTVREFAQLRPSGSLLRLGQAAPASMTPSRGGKPGHEQPIAVPSRMIVGHPERIEYEGGKFKRPEHLVQARAAPPVRALRIVAAGFLTVTLPALSPGLRRPKLPGMEEPLARRLFRPR
jgi:hypothetical protein